MDPRVAALRGKIALARQRKESAIGTERHAELAFAVRAAAGEDRVLEFVASTEEIASDGLIVLASSWNVDRYLKAGAFLWAHNRWEDKPPIGVPVSATLEQNRLTSKVRFAKAADFPFADVVYRLYLDGILRAVSVGFRILEMRDANQAEKASGAWGVVTKCELYELSAVPVPADAGALLQGVKKGLLTQADRDALEFAVARSSAKPQGDAPWREALEALRSPAVSPKPQALRDVAANVEALQDLARTIRQAADVLEETAADVAADSGQAPASDTQKASEAAAVRAAVEAAEAPLRARIRDLEVELEVTKTRAAIRAA